MTEQKDGTTEQAVSSSDESKRSQGGMTYKAAKNLAATQRRDGTNRDAYAVYDVALGMWTVS